MSNVPARQAPPRQAQTGSTALARPAQQAATLAGTFRDAKAITARLQEAAEHFHLVSPATSCGQLPEGCSIALSTVVVDTDNDTYAIPGPGGKFGLSKSTLQKVSAAVGVTWDPIASGRLDDGSHPHYCRWRAVGKYRAFDGQEQVIVAEKELDLRDGSSTCVSMEAAAKAKGKTAEAQIREQRAHIQSHAETKAQLRAIRSLGIKTGYTRDELKKPFVAARIMFTGHSDDPALRRMFAERTADAFLGGRSALYALPPAPTQSGPAQLPPPPVGSTQREDDDDDDRLPEGALDGAPIPPAEASGHVIPGGKNKGEPIETAPEKDLQYWADRIGNDLNQGRARNPERDGALHKALLAELARREGDGAIEGPQDDDQGGSDDGRW